MTLWKRKRVSGKRVSVSTLWFPLLESLSVVNSANNDPAKIRWVFPLVAVGNTFPLFAKGFLSVVRIFIAFTEI